MRAESADKQEKGRTKSEEEADEMNKKQEERLKETKKEWCDGGDKREKWVRTKIEKSESRGSERREKESYKTIK